MGNCRPYLSNTMSDPKTERIEEPKNEPLDEKPVAPSSEENPDSASKEEPARRDFLQKAGSIVLGGAMVAAPAAVGLRVVSCPLFGGKVNGVLARLTTLDSIVAGGPPQAFKVMADKTDAWTTYKNLPLGLVYAQRDKEGALTVFSASCPHAGCAVEYRNTQGGEQYYCPCHESKFNLDGSLSPDNTQAPRGLDTLEVDEEKLATGEVWVRFRKFKAGVPEKKAIS